MTASRSRSTIFQLEDLAQKEAEAEAMTCGTLELLRYGDVGTGGHDIMLGIQRSRYESVI